MSSIYTFKDSLPIEVSWKLGDLSITGKFNTPADRGMWRYTLISDDGGIVNVFSYTQFPTLLDVCLSLKMAIKNLDVARAGKAPQFEHSLYAAEIQQLSHHLDKLKEIVTEYLQD